MGKSSDATQTEWLTTNELVEELGIALQTYYNWRQEGRAPKAIQLGKTLKTSRADLNEWLEEHKTTGRTPRVVRK
ncbi:helix-turn-helix transcriptional regulator [Arthrobacter sp. D2-10]